MSKTFDTFTKLSVIDLSTLHYNNYTKQVLIFQLQFFRLQWNLNIRRTPTPRDKGPPPKIYSISYSTDADLYLRTKKSYILWCPYSEVSLYTQSFCVITIVVPHLWKRQKSTQNVWLTQTSNEELLLATMKTLLFFGVQATTKY